MFEEIQRKKVFINSSRNYLEDLKHAIGNESKEKKLQKSIVNEYTFKPLSKITSEKFFATNIDFENEYEYLNYMFSKENLDLENFKPRKEENYQKNYSTTYNNYGRKNDNYDFFTLEKFFYEKFNMKAFGQNRIGRLNRIGYLLFLFIFGFIISLGLAFIGRIMFEIFGKEIAPIFAVPLGIIGIVYFIILFILIIRIDIRRLHDLNMNGWHIIWTFVPGIGVLFMLCLLFAPGTPGDNNYGASPKKQ